METCECLDALASLTYSHVCFYAVDNHSMDGNLELLRKRERKDQQVLIPSEENLGSAHGNNQGLRKASQDDCDYLRLLDSDSILDPDSLVQLAKY